jgi:hypothetical protein
MNRAGDWKTYAAAAGATLAMATNASADIVYSGPLDVTASIPSSGDNDSFKPFNVAGFRVNLSIYNFTDIFYSYTYGRRTGGFRDAVAAIGGNLLFAVNAHMSHALYRYNAGQPISGVHIKEPLGYLNRAAGGTVGVVTHTGGAFGPGTVTGFVGFETYHRDLGWMRMKVSVGSNGFPDEEEVIDYAYNTVPGAPIDAGEVPEPSGVALGFLTIGAAGLLAWRRRRSEVASK